MVRDSSYTPLWINGGFISEFLTKAYHFNRCFSRQDTAIFIESSIPPSVNVDTDETQMGSDSLKPLTVINFPKTGFV